MAETISKYLKRLFRIARGAAKTNRNCLHPQAEY